MYAILTMRQCRKLSRRSFVAIVERHNHSFLPIEELSTTECQTGISSCDRYCGEWLTREMCISKHNLHYILAVTGSQWSSRSAEDVIVWLQVQYSMCCHMKDSGLIAVALMWTGHQETPKDDVAVVKTGKCESSNQSDSDITSELLTTDGTDESITPEMSHCRC